MIFKRQLDNLKGFASMAGDSFADVMTGRIFKKDFIRRQAFVIVMCVVFLFCHIGLRFSCENQVKQIDLLQKQLEDVRLEYLSRSAELQGMGKQSQIKRMVAERDSTLLPSVEPPFRISK
ncbi:MAG: hypothetical protein K6F48_07225 [Paludibacteraceae bacterium]|nr:hypothetical protein [Paludibacteraceae bacterium]